MYMALKHIHLTAVALTLASFLIRGLWMVTESGLLQQRWVRILPHVIDTVLLASALGLVYLAWSHWPAWIIAKVVGLLVYILLGTIALKRGRTKTQRVWALLGALLVFAYIVAVGLTKQPLPLP